MTGDDDDIEALVRRADPVRTAPARLDPELVERIVGRGPAGPRRRPVVLAAVAATIFVTVGAFALMWSLGGRPDDSAVSATSPSVAATPTHEATLSQGPTSSPASRCATGWKASRLPAGYRLSDPDDTRRRGWD